MKTIHNYTRSILFSFLLLALIACPQLQAQTPDGVNYQGVARDASGNALINQNISLRFTLHATNATGPIQYQETHAVTTSALGLFDLVIGSGTATQGNFSMVNWGGDAHFMQIELDPSGGSNYFNLGASELMAVPYALNARSVENDLVDDADADPSNELQSLTTNGNTITLSNGGGTITDQVNDADPNPTNEIQVLSKVGNTVTLSNGGGSFTDDAGDNDWTFSGNDIYSANSGDVGIGVTNPGSKLSVRNSLDVQSSGGARNGRLYLGSSNAGVLQLFGGNASRNVLISFGSSSTDLGSMGIYNATANQRWGAAIGSADNVGLSWTYGPNNNLNTYSNYLTGNPNNGYFGVYDSNSLEAGMYVNSSGQGVVFGDIKNFRMEHPTLPGKEIWYASLEGPEAGAYSRGTGTLINGSATIQFDDHFEIVANATTMTVIVTPLDGSSKGIAVVEKTATGFRVVELMNGNGSYDFDWEVKAVRKGYENYRVVRDEIESRPGGLDENGRPPVAGE